MKTIRQKVHDLVLESDLADEVVDLIKEDILPKYKQDLIDLILLQPVQFVTTNNVIGLIKGMKTEWGVKQ